MRHARVAKATQPAANRVRDRVRGRSKTLCPETKRERPFSIRPRVWCGLLSWRSSQISRSWPWPSQISEGAGSRPQPYALALVTDTSNACAPAATTGRTTEALGTDITHTHHAARHALRGSVHRIQAGAGKRTRTSGSRSDRGRRRRFSRRCSSTLAATLAALTRGLVLRS